jgi:hypothetical protein
MHEYKALTLRSNLFLVSALVEHGLLDVAHSDAANKKFIVALQSESAAQASVLSVLLHELTVRDERALIQLLADKYDLALIDLDFIQISSLSSQQRELNLCRATATVPYDQVEDTYMLATCYYLSAPVITHWEQLLAGPVLWYATSFAAMALALGRLQEIYQTEADVLSEVSK